MKRMEVVRKEKGREGDFLKTGPLDFFLGPTPSFLSPKNLKRCG